MIGNALAEIGSFEAKNKLAELLERATKGEEIIITRRGLPVARLMPPASEEAGTPKVAASRILDRAKGAALGNVALHSLISGRRA
jgi:prevent-host-death family protein